MRFEFTRDMDLWIDRNSSRYPKGHRQEMVDDFNSIFGTSISKEQMKSKIKRQMSPNTRYTEEQNEWLKDHWYMARKDMTKAFNETFNTNRSYKTILNKCCELGAVKEFNSTKTTMESRTVTPEMDEWIVRNADHYRRSHREMLRELNFTFGKSITLNGLRDRIYALGASSFLYTKEEDEWLMEHRDMDRKVLFPLFNETFSRDRSDLGIQSRMTKIGAWNRSFKSNVTKMEGRYAEAQQQ